MWSSCRAYIQGEDDVLVKVGPLSEIIPDWRDLMSHDLSPEEYETLRRHERSGRPLGSEDFLNLLEKMTVRLLKRQKPGPKGSN